MKNENISERNKLVDKLVKLIKVEWEEEKRKFIIAQHIYFDEDACLTKEKFAEFNSVLDTLAAYSNALAWIKHNVIDNNGIIFRHISQSDGNGNAIFWVDTETIEILIKEKNFVRRVMLKCLDYVNSEFNNLSRLFTYGETNIADEIVSILDRVQYKKIKE